MKTISSRCQTCELNTHMLPSTQKKKYSFLPHNNKRGMRLFQMALVMRRIMYLTSALFLVVIIMSSTSCPSCQCQAGNGKDPLIAKQSIFVWFTFRCF